MIVSPRQLCYNLFGSHLRLPQFFREDCVAPDF